VTSRIVKIYGAGPGHFVPPESGADWRLRIQVGSDLYDGSVKTRLEQLEQSF